MDVRFLGHACFELSEGDTHVLVDPFLTGNPKALKHGGPVKAMIVQNTNPASVAPEYNSGGSLQATGHTEWVDGHAHQSGMTTA